MPELPEIETIRRDLKDVLLDRSVVALQVRDRRLLSAAQEKRYRSIVHGQPWRTFERKGKYLMVRLANQWTLIFHLRMTGQLVVAPGSESPAAYRMRFEFDNGLRLSFCDQRRFGEVFLVAPQGPWPSRSILGPDVMEELNRELFVKIVKQRTTRIQPLLMDQRTWSGVGNIYAQEALFKAAIRPSRQAYRMTRLEAGRLFDALRETLATAIELRGSTSRNYRDAYGRQGSAQNVHAVYRRGGKPCPRCQTPLRAIRVGGRGSVFCAQCQR